MPDYQKSKIYRLVCNITGKQYIGSTVSKLSKRKGQHKEKYYKWLKGEKTHMTSFDIIEKGDYDIILIEAYPCNTKEELLKRERHYIETMECINKQLPTQNHKEWYEKNKEYVSKKGKEYRQQNKEVVALQKKKYYSENKETLLSKRKVKVICECGSTICKITKNRHEKTKKHQDFIKTLEII